MKELKGWKGVVVYAILGIIIALLSNQTLGFVLSTDMPVVAVVSSSMQHDNEEVTHYKWLEDNLGYNRSYIDSWSVPNGFNVGDMPVIQGSSEYGVGDVIVYSRPGQSVPIIHRIIKINLDRTYQTKGDNNTGQMDYELSVGKEQIHGKAIFIIPKLGYFKVIVSKVIGEV